MFENLSDKLQRAFKNLRGQGIINEENIGEALKEIRMALLEADVNFKVVKELIEHIREKALGQEVMTALSPTEQVIKIMRDELIAILGKDTAKLKFASQPPTIVLMAGLQGSGKTTTSGKLAKWLREQEKKKPLLVSTDMPGSFFLNVSIAASSSSIVFGIWRLSSFSQSARMKTAWVWPRIPRRGMPQILPSPSVMPAQL